MPSCPEAHRGTTGVFVWALLKILARKACIAARKIRGLRMSARVVSTCVAFVSMAALLLLCGDIERNPGPVNTGMETAVDSSCSMKNWPQRYGVHNF
ncbi:hypothetical protein BaRGS_00039987 [Batillaria attramentaria]|uniref:Uncharacterized protein n=1 Tax=Batillaria attramentaria TaxID=370345 RepID=A0ABD0J1T7_9CAEN